MSPKIAVLECIAVLAGAMIGTVVAALFAWLFTGADFLAAVSAPAHYILALVTVAIFAVLYHYLPGTPAALASLAVGILLPSLIVKFSFDTAMGWATVLFLNLVFALAALSVYRFVHANGRARSVAADVSDRL